MASSFKILCGGLFCLSFFALNAQVFPAYDVPFFQGNTQLGLALAGGLNAAQFSEIDLNEDGSLDLYVFDREGNKSICFINSGTLGEVDYQYAPEYEILFPEMNNFVLLRDFNKDGLMDIFAHSSVPGVFGVEVYQGVKTTNGLGFNKLSFSEGEVDILYYRQSNGHFTNLYVSNIDLPAIDDVDGDGDMDILTFNISGGFLEYYQNQSVEMGFGADSLKFILADNCWGKFFESGFSEVIALSSDMTTCANGLHDPLIQIRHSGSTVLSFDNDGDGDVEVILGDVSFSNLNLLTNGGSPDAAFVTSQDTFFPSYDRPVNLNIFPAGYLIDVNNDGLKDLLAAPNNVNGENFNAVWYYQNQGTNQQPVFRLQQFNLFIEEMVDLGSGAHPCFVDYNDDGLMDLLVGNAGFYLPGGARDSRLFLYENIGDANNPRYRLIDDNYLDFQQFSDDFSTFTPCFGDLDNDGDLDLLAGEGSGSLFFAENIAGPNKTFQFAPVQFGYMGIDVGQMSAPQIADLNRDGLPDLVIGERNGNLNFLKNMGSENSPQFIADLSNEANNEFFGEVNTQVPNAFTGHSSPLIIQVDDTFRLFTGSEFGNIGQYIIAENQLDGAFERISDQLGGIRAGNRTHPAFADLDNDGLLEMVIGSRRGGLSAYKTNIKSNRTVPVKEVAESFDFRFFPNPAKDEINLVFPGSSIPFELSIYDLIGRQLKTQSLEGGRHSIPLTGLPKGVYILVINRNRQQVATKLLVH